jgi:hypothetical protein
MSMRLRGDSGYRPWTFNVPLLVKTYMCEEGREVFKMCTSFCGCMCVCPGALGLFSRCISDVRLCGVWRVARNNPPRQETAEIYGILLHVVCVLFLSFAGCLALCDTLALQYADPQTSQQQY